MDRVVIVGAGQGGFQAAVSLREGGFAGAVTLIGEEPEPPYGRPPLSKAYLSGASDREKVTLRPASFFAEHRIELRTGLRVDGIDRDAATLRLGTGERLAYDHLVLATGSRNRVLPVPGAELDGVYSLRGLADAERLKDELARAQRVVVIGAGFIGLEVAATAAKGGAAVTVIEATDRVMTRAVSRPISAAFARRHEARGVAFLFGAVASAIHGHEGRAIAVEVAAGLVVEADLVLVGIGILPNTELAAAAGLDVRNGVVADDRLLTADPAISAIGDCVSFPSRHMGGAPVLIESVQNAVDGARFVAGRLLGGIGTYAPVPWFWSDQGPDKLQIAGLANPHEETLVLGDPAEAAFSVLCFRGGELAAVESVNRPGDHMAARRLLAGARAPSRTEAAAAGFDLREAARRAA